MEKPHDTRRPGMDRVIVRSPWRKRAPWLIGGAAALLLLVAVVFLVPRGDVMSVAADETRVIKVEQGPFEDFLPVRASVEPAETVFIDTVEGGRIEQLLVEDGAIVEAGTLLAVLANPQLELEVIAQEAAISAQLSGVSGQLLALQRTEVDRQREASEANYNLLRASRELEITEQLHRAEIESDAALRAARTEAEYHREQVETIAGGRAPADRLATAQAGEIQATGRRLQNNLQAVRRSLVALEIRAPVEGRLTAFELQPGQSLEPGERVGQVDSEGAYKLRADIDEFYLGRVALGQKATASFGDDNLPLTISRLFPQVRDGRFQIELTFDREAPAGVRRGQTLDLRVTLGATRQALILPNGPWLAATGGNWIFVVDDNGGNAERRTISVGRRNPSQVEITDGLRAGDRVVVSSYAAFETRDRLILR